MSNKINLLNYWHKLEYFSPFYPKRDKKMAFTIDPINCTFKDEFTLPWSSGKNMCIYSLYLGHVKTMDIISSIDKATESKSDFVEKDTSKNIIFAMKITPNGMYTPKSFTLNKFVWASSVIINAKTLDVELLESDCEAIESDFDRMLLNDNRPLSKDIIGYLYDEVKKKLNICFDNELKGIIYSDTMTQEEKEALEKGEVDKIKPYLDIIPSFYTDDIKKVQSSIVKGSTVSEYLEFEKNVNRHKNHIDCNKKEIESWIKPDKFPLGKWPSKYSPFLMQQIGVNIAISDEQKVFSINGPPGSGKTTLLKEIIASNLVERAIILAQYSSPDDAFSKTAYSEYTSSYYQNYYRLDDELSKHGILVASNNNKAVENITQELPNLDEVVNSKSGCFDDCDNIYFTKTSKVYNGDDSWGMIAARLGNSSNINKACSSVFFDKDVGLNTLVKGDAVLWTEAVKSFNKALQEVNNHRLFINEHIKSIGYKEQIELELESLVSLMKEKNAEIEKINMLCRTERVDCSKVKSMIKGRETDIESVSKSIGLVEKFLHLILKNSSNIKYVEEIKTELLKLRAEAKKYEDKLIGLESQLRHHEIEIDSMRINKDNVESKLRLVCETLSSSVQMFGENIVDGDFFENIKFNPKSQMKCPWTYDAYDASREKLFLESLKLHESFILNSKAVVTNIRLFSNAYGSNLLEVQKAESFSHLLNTFQLMVPVVSTTFASVSRFLKYAKSEELGTLVIDEAGQGTPQSAVGAIWRSKKVIVVGDPSQVEPVTTVPKQLQRRFSKEYYVNDMCCTNGISVQHFADASNLFVGTRKIEGNEAVIGCPLVIHRRCVEPMFTIANEIAYNGQMIRMSEEVDVETSKKLLLPRSSWLDIKGNANGKKDHFVQEQAEEVIAMIMDYFTTHGALPDMFIISPFKTVANGFKAQLRKAFSPLLSGANAESKKVFSSYVKDYIGTVHTFQGKQAKEVVILLGCEKNVSEGAVAWAGKKPNILNVAVTRAKYRLCIVGDVDLWGSVRYFEVARKTLMK